MSKICCKKCLNNCCNIFPIVFIIFAILIIIVIIFPYIQNNNSNFSFKKLNSLNNEPLENITFVLVQCNILIDVSTSNSDGIVNFFDIPSGEYNLIETSATEGYLPDTNSYNVVVNNNGNVSINGIPANEFIVKNVPITRYTITYEPNGGSTDVPISEVVSENTKYTIINNPFNSDKRFVEWNTKPDGTGTSYKPGDTIVINSDITLYAIWEEIPQSTPPTINTTTPSNFIVSGTGIPSSTIKLIFPNGTSSQTIVNTLGLWNVQVPTDEQPLVEGTTLTAYQTEVGKSISQPVEIKVTANT